ncbi:Os04g0330400 [Oryza sativa Japonica Group]|uniref:Os04g0330400 protein n=1 Tax=Oryza sativa subsp. japonica TaxID=39947 RepID=C7J1N3_ORYSJ|nr:Os04g0330400 [Oryza sativa Japonica Group]|eukprot:NP_001173872.1 Os04g0330400 [Oryza sativa Japonica Group]
MCISASVTTVVVAERRHFRHRLAPLLTSPPPLLRASPPSPTVGAPPSVAAAIEETAVVTEPAPRKAVVASRRGGPGVELQSDVEAGGTQELADELDTEQLGLESKIMAIRNFLEGPRPSQPPQRRAGEIVSLLQNRLNMNITFKELQDGPAAAQPPLGPHALTGHHQQGHPASSAGEGDQPLRLPRVHADCEAVNVDDMFSLRRDSQIGKDQFHESRSNMVDHRANLVQVVGFPPWDMDRAIIHNESGYKDYYTNNRVSKPGRKNKGSKQPESVLSLRKWPSTNANYASV